MSTVATQDTAAKRTNRELAVRGAMSAHVPAKRSALSRFFAWYREAVLSPATEKEQADWQKHSF